MHFFQKRLCSNTKEGETVYYSPFGYVSTQGGIVNIASKNGSEFLRTLYGYTSSQSDGIMGQIFYEGCLLSPSEVLTLMSYISHETWLCNHLTVNEYIENTINLNLPLWVYWIYFDLKIEMKKRGKHAISAF